MGDIILYSTGCPKCKILKKKLDDKNIHYTECNDVDYMLSLGFKDVPVLEIDKKYYNFGEAIKWLTMQK